MIRYRRARLDPAENAIVTLDRDRLFRTAGERKRTKSAPVRVVPEFNEFMSEACIKAGGR